MTPEYLDLMVEGLVEIIPSVSRLVTCSDPDPDVPPEAAELGLGWAGEVLHYDENALRPTFEGSPVYELRDGRHAIIKDGKFLEVRMIVNVMFIPFEGEG